MEWKDKMKIREEFSFFMIKPYAYSHKEEIIDILKTKLNIVSMREVTIAQDFLEKLYQDEEEIIKKMNIAYLKDKKVVMGIASGENAKKELVMLSGSDFRPQMCEKESIRYLYSKKEPIEICGIDFYINAIHRAMPEDAEKEVNLYWEEIILKEKKKLGVSCYEQQY